MFAGGFAGLFLLFWFGYQAVSGVRCFLQTEAVYTRSQKDAVHHLQRFATTLAEEDWQRYAESIAAPLAIARAHLLLLEDVPDRQALRAALLEGGHRPDDLDALLWLFRHRHRLPRMAQSVELLAQADALLERLDDTARRFREKTLGPGVGRTDLLALLDETSRLNRELTELERSIFDDISEGAREKASEVLWISGSAIVLLLGTGVAVSARLLRRLRRRDEHFQSILENTSDVITIVDDNGRILYESPAIERVLGYSPEELVGSFVFDWIHPDDLAARRVAFSEFVESPPTAETAEFRFRHADGSWRTLAATGSVYRDESGALRILVNSRDITLQRQLETRLAQTGRLESVGRLAGGVAHDFNNLLTAILGAAEAARALLPESSIARVEVDEIVSAAGRATELTRQLLAFARRQVVEPVVFDIAEVVTEMEAILRRLLTENVELTIAVPEEPALVRADRSQIEQVIVNLAANARDAMPDGGRLRISVERRCLDRQTAEREVEGNRGPFVVLEVEDSGIAMDAAVLERIFEPFFSTKEASRNAGLGLATTYGIVKQSGGFIAVTSERSRGSCFRVHLPASEEPKTVEVEVEGRRDTPAAGSETLLLVEDQAEVRKVAARVLRARGYVVVEMPDGEEALHWARKHPRDFDLVVTDVVMPRLGGAALAEMLRKQRPDLPVVFTSGYPDDERLLAASDATTALVQKPFAPNVLVARVRSLLDEQRAARLS